VPFCAPMQLFHGLISRMSKGNADLVFLPMLLNLPFVGGEQFTKTCPIVQGAPDVVRWSLGLDLNGRLISPVIQFGPENLISESFRDTCRQIAETLGAPKAQFNRAFDVAVKVQQQFDQQCIDIGRRALKFCQEHEIPPVVVLGRPYTIYNRVLNSNVPNLLREQGAVAIPLDCYPTEPDQPVFPDIYWGYGQRILRAASQIRRTPGVYAIYTSNYSCGPDSFNIHFCMYVMDGKPFAIVETDGHSGDAGTKTRVEAFLHCVREDRANRRPKPPTKDFRTLGSNRANWNTVRQENERVLIPRMGVAAEVVAACFQGTGVDAETLPMPDREAVRLGRKYTSGKECLPMCVTLGSLLQRLQRENDTNKRFVFLMPRATGPCRFGVYHLLHQIVVEHLKQRDRVRIWSPNDIDYYVGLPQGFRILLYAGVTSADYLHQALLDVRPVETRKGAANEIYAFYHSKLLETLKNAAAANPSQSYALWQVVSGELFGLRRLLIEAANAFAAVHSWRQIPTVLVVGEIYVRLDPFSNDFVVDKLEQRGIRARLAPTTEWLEYVEECNLEDATGIAISQRLVTWIQNRISDLAYESFTGPLRWPPRPTVRETLSAASGYIRPALRGEAVLTFGSPVHEWRRGDIDGVVSVGPLECMPNKLAEAQFYHAAEREDLLSLTLSLNGDPIALEALDSFAFELHARFSRKIRHRDPKTRPTSRSPVP
ncbi:MAG: acyl-CoA dehydratase activase-related protein, partial [Verrucomicrobiae bacterium]|nr:acyl-CoA dehydratase activase-related protein [Verrucomicrobiae bacterium]